MFVYASILIGVVYSDLIRIQFVANPELYLTMDKVIPSEPVFISASKKWIRELPNYCGIASRRNIDNEFNEFFFCGMKMCFDEEVQELYGCNEDEYNTKWELVMIERDKYLLKNNDYCITIKGESRVEMLSCSDFNVKQQVMIEPYDRSSAAVETTDTSKAIKQLNMIKRLGESEEFFRRESLLL